MTDPSSPLDGRQRDRTWQRAMAVAHAASDLRDLDLRGADLRGHDVSWISLRTARLDGADLRGARLRYVELDRAVLDGCDLRGAELTAVSAAGASLRGINGAGLTWSNGNLATAVLADAQLSETTWNACVLDDADLRHADARSSRWVGCSLAGADLDGSDWDGALTPGTRCPRALLGGARRFAWCRELVLEVLRLHLGDDLERAQVLAAAMVATEWCYPRWERWLAEHRSYRDLAYRIFADYPQSGCLEALGLVTESRP
jgi:hypothetical protein